MGQVENTVGLLYRELYLFGKLPGIMSVVAMAELYHFHMVAGIFAFQQIDAYCIQDEAVFTEAVEGAIPVPVEIEPPVAIKIVMFPFRGFYNELAMGGPGQRELFFYMLTGAEIVHDHTCEGDGTEQADDPQGRKSISQVMLTRADAGDTADQPGKEGEHRNYQEEEKACPGQEVLPGAGENKILDGEDAGATKDQAYQDHDETEGDQPRDEQEEGFKQYADGADDAAAGPACGRICFRCEVLGTLLHLFACLLES